MVPKYHNRENKQTKALSCLLDLFCHISKRRELGLNPDKVSPYAVPIKQAEVVIPTVFQFGKYN